MVDTHAARELELYIENDSALYHGQTVPIQKSLATKYARGEYKHDLAVKAFGYLVEAGAKKFAREFGTGAMWHKMFDVPTRRKVAEAFAENFEENVTLGHYDKLLPQKYLLKKRPAASHAKMRKGGEAPRVEILESGDSKYFKPGQFGYVVGETSRGGMHTLDRGVSSPGELTYLVSKGGGGGALWFSAGALRFTGRRPVDRSLKELPRKKSPAQLEHEIRTVLGSRAVPTRRR